MRRQLVLMALAIGLPFIGTGCSAMILASQHSLESPANLAFPLGTSRQEVETKLGKPLTSRALPAGGRADTYKYIIRKVEDFSLTTSISSTARISEVPMWVLLTISAISLGGTDIVIAPMVLYDVSKSRRTATFTYDPSDRLLDHGPPPAYGPPDDALGSLSMNEIRERCRSEARGDQRDFECVVRRLAIWGIE